MRAGRCSTGIGPDDTRLTSAIAKRDYLSGNIVQGIARLCLETVEVILAGHGIRSVPPPPPRGMRCMLQAETHDNLYGKLSPR
jgi:hypothetical protein